MAVKGMKSSRRLFGWGGVVELHRHDHNRRTYWEIVKHMTLKQQASVSEVFNHPKAVRKDAQMVKVALKMGDGQRWP